MQVLPREKNLAKKRSSFCQEIKVQPRRDIGFVNKENFSQKGIQVLSIEKS